MLGKWGWRYVIEHARTSQPENRIYPTITENKFIIWNYSFSGPNRIYLFEFSNNDNIICEICSKLTIEASDIVLGYLLFTLNIFDVVLVGVCFVVVDFEHVNARWNSLLPQSKFIWSLQSRTLGILSHVRQSSL